MKGWPLISSLRSVFERYSLSCVKIWLLNSEKVGDMHFILSLATLVYVVMVSHRAACCNNVCFLSHGHVHSLFCTLFTAAAQHGTDGAACVSLACCWAWTVKSVSGSFCYGAVIWAFESAWCYIGVTSQINRTQLIPGDTVPVGSGDSNYCRKEMHNQMWWFKSKWQWLVGTHS